MNPRYSTIDLSQNITTCTIGAGWGSSSMLTSFSDNNVYFSPTELLSSYKSLLNNEGDLPVGLGLVPTFDTVFANVSGFAYPQRPMQMPPEWLACLNPVSTLPDGTNKNVVNAYMLLVPAHLEPFSVAKILLCMVEAGFAISGLNLPWQGIYSSRALLVDY